MSNKYNNMSKKAPEWLSHKPIISVDYEEHDANAGDAKFLSLGKSTWNKEDYSAKVWRQVYGSDHWSRQSEELPLWRVLDLATLLVAVINKRSSSLKEFIQNSNELDSLRAYIDDNMELLAPKMNELRELLGETYLGQIQNDKAPNIFSYATSELSQDAMFAWLIRWADPAYKNSDTSLHNAAQKFVRLLTGKGESFEINKVNVGRHWENIDVWAEINDNTFLVIEDKTGTSIHDDQLNRYRKSAENYYNGKRSDLCYAYIKTENEPASKLNYINKCGYRTIDREDILKCINNYSGTNPLLLSYREHLQSIEDQSQRFHKLPVSKWQWYEWQGFYKLLESKLDKLDWNYVSNPAGGFLGCWWHFVDIEDGEMYLQIEQGKLCFKIHYDGESNRSDIRWKYHKNLMKAKGDEYNEITKPDRFGAGTYMTIASVSKEDLFGEGIVDIDAVVDKLKEYQELIDKCCLKID